MGDRQKLALSDALKSDTSELIQAKDRVGRIFKYLRALHARKSPPITEISGHPWSLYLDELLPHPNIVLQYPSAPTSSFTEGTNSFEVTVSRPKESKCPPPPSILRDWLVTGWDLFGNTPAYLEARNLENLLGQLKTERFDENIERVVSFEKWYEQRQAWEEAERPTQLVLGIFSKLFDLYGRMEREAEKYQLWLGDGNLQWTFGSKVFSHPLILQRVELKFDPKIPAFSIVESIDPPELHATILRYGELDGRRINELSQSMKSSPRHPLGGEETNTFLKQLAHIFWEDGALELKSKISSDYPSGKAIINRRSVLFLGPRAQGFDAAMSRIESYLEVADELPESLMRIVGFETTRNSVKLNDSHLGSLRLKASDGLSLSDDVLLTKPANEEQIRVIRKLVDSGSVIVQGPPGTGKTHTIANLIGHLLAEGKTVLVTSHTAKALRVVREKVHETLRPLCVSVLGSDECSQRELEESISGIVGYLSRTDRAALDAEIGILEKRRMTLIDQHNHVVQELLRAKRSEYDDLVCGGETISPSSAARFLAQNQEHRWIPGPISLGSAMPLSPEEIVDLYASNDDVTSEVDRALANPLPCLEELPLESEFVEIVEELNFLSHPSATPPFELIADSKLTDDLRQLLSIGREFEKTLASGEAWYLEVLLAGLCGGPQRDLWQGFTKLLRSHRDEVILRQELILTYGPVYSGDADGRDLASIAKQIFEHLEGGGKIGLLSTLFKSEWKRLIASHRVNNLEPKVAIHFRSIAAFHEIQLLREEIIVRWKRQMEPLQAQPAATFGEKIEEFVGPFADRLDRALSWADELWIPFVNKIRDCGLPWNRIEQEASDRTLGKSSIDRLKEAVGSVLSLVQTQIAHLRRAEIDNARDKWKNYLLRFFGNGEVGHPVFELRTAIETCDTLLYRRARRRLVDISSLEKRMLRRTELLRRLEDAAPAWGQVVRARIEPHHRGSPPGVDFEAAWKYRQWSCQLELRHKFAIDDLQRDLMTARDELYQVSAKYVEKRAWRAQADRTGLKQKQALIGWLDIQRKIGKGTGKRVPRLQAEARQLLLQCKDTVPVWVMPTSRVYESFDPTRSRFDVLILDEASQCDVTDIALFALAKEVVVVGDHEQVSPQAVGQEIGSMQALIDEFLIGIPNAVQYDPRTSVYHLARQSFGETIRLVEHFRCVPDIISFSNALSYSGEIKPLREASSAKVYPPMIAHRVLNGISLNKVNLVEVDELTSLILAANENTAYANLTFGVISMVGIEQALRIEENLRRFLSPDHFAARRILCGNASQFQGDERDVMFLSMVDSVGENSGPLNMRNTEDWRKVFNVAASRARDQVWVVHSLNSETDLKNEDIRKRFIQHAENPSATQDQKARVESRSESEFERLVGQGLTDAGFRIQMQFEVGAYRIDMVIFDRKRRRVALECDGDRWHPPEKHGEDLARQFVLERLGWRFIRIRGSEFFSDKPKAIQRLIIRIRELGVEPDLLAESSQSSVVPVVENGYRREIVAASEQWRDRIWQIRSSEKNTNDNVVASRGTHKVQKRKS